ncbi:protein of unknown function [Burkholderia multivorans]
MSRFGPLRPASAHHHQPSPAITSYHPLSPALARSRPFSLSLTPALIGAQTRRATHFY